MRRPGELTCLHRTLADLAAKRVSSLLSRGPKVAAARKPCYVEKPLARTAAESREIAEAFESAGVPLFVAYYRRGQQKFRKAKVGS